MEDYQKTEKEIENSLANQNVKYSLLGGFSSLIKYGALMEGIYEVTKNSPNFDKVIIMGFSYAIISFSQNMLDGARLRRTIIDYIKSRENNLEKIIEDKKNIKEKN